MPKCEEENKFLKEIVNRNSIQTKQNIKIQFHSFKTHKCYERANEKLHDNNKLVCNSLY